MKAPNPEYLHKKAIPVPLYRGDLVILLTNSEPMLLKEIPIFESRDLFAHALYGNHKGNSGFFVVLNFDHSNTRINNGCIAHEALHVTSFVLHDRGVVADFNNDEPQAYLLNWVVDQIHKFVHEKGFKVEI